MADIEDQLRNEPTRIEVDGTPYVLPALDTFDLDEAMVMYRYSHLTFDQIFELEGLHPGVIAGLLHVAIARSDPALRDRQVEEQVRKVNMMAVFEQFAEIAENVADPTKGSVQPPEPDEPTSSEDQTRPSGESSEPDSETPQEQQSHASSGVPVSDTIAISVQQTSGTSQPIS